MVLAPESGNATRGAVWRPDPGDRRNALAGRTARSEPEILIDPREADALRQLIAGVREGRIDLTAAQTIASPAAAEIEPVARIVIAPITIEPIAPVPGAEGITPVMKPFETFALVVAFGLGSTALVRIAGETGARRRRRRRPSASVAATGAEGSGRARAIPGGEEN